MVTGRPTIYNDGIIIKVQEYLDLCKDEELEFHKTRSDSSNSFERRTNVKIPTIEGLALHINISRRTIYQWLEDKISEEFSHIIDKLQQKQADMLISGGLSGNYNPTIAKVLLTKHGYRDSQELVGKDGKDLPIPILNLNVPSNDSNQESSTIE